MVRLHHPSGTSLDDAHDFTQQVLSGVRFAPLIHRPIAETVIPSRVWNPSIHHYYPDSFRKSCKELLMCSNACYVQPVKPQPTERLNVASMLPAGVWMEILSYTHRDCKFFVTHVALTVRGGFLIDFSLFVRSISICRVRITTVRGRFP